MCFFDEYSNNNSDNIIFCTRCYGSPQSRLVCIRCHRLTPLKNPDHDLIIYYCEDCRRNNNRFKNNYLCPECKQLIN